MWQKFKKVTGRTPSQRIYSNEEMRIIGWCLENNISIGCMPDWKNDSNKWLIDIKINKNTYTDPNTYEDDTVLNKIYEYYKYYYDKYKN